MYTLCYTYGFFKLLLWLIWAVNLTYLERRDPNWRIVSLSLACEGILLIAKWRGRDQPIVGSITAGQVALGFYKKGDWAEVKSGQ